MKWHLIRPDGTDDETGQPLPGIGPSFASIAGMDPLADWLLGPGFEDFAAGFGPPEVQDKALIPCMMRVNGERAEEALAEITDELFIPPAYWADYEKQVKTIKPETEFVAFARKGFFEEVRDGPRFKIFRDVDKSMALGSPIWPQAFPEGWEPGLPQPILPEPVIGPPDGGWPDDTVVLGIIDFGIAFANERFRNAQGSRVQSFWRQSGDYGGAGSTVAYGRELTKTDIDVLYATSQPGGVVDEDLLYQRAGLIDFSTSQSVQPASLRITHGTHVLDVFAGPDGNTNVKNRPIIAVELPADAVADTSFRLLETYVFYAFRHILTRALLLAGPSGPKLPVVINFSFGQYAAPHDGTLFLERVIDSLIALPVFADRLRIVLPAGNGHLAQGHIRPTFNASGEQAVSSWRLQPDDKTHSLAEIWVPEQILPLPAPSRVSLQMRAPEGVPSPALEELHGWRIILIHNGQTIAGAGYCYLSGVTDKGVFLLATASTAGFEPSALEFAPAGAWELVLKNNLLSSSDDIHAWIHRDESLYGFPLRGRQSYFDNDCYLERDDLGWLVEEDAHPDQPLGCMQKRDSQVNGLATGKLPITVGASFRKPRPVPPHLAGTYHPRLTPYTAGGPMARPSLGSATDKPDTVVTGDDSRVHSGVLAAGSHSGSTVALNGTSVAAPRLAREIADELAAGNPADRNWVKTDVGGGMPVHDNRLGFGIMELQPIRRHAVLNTYLRRFEE